MKLENFGAHIIAPGEVRFRLWAPDCERVSVVFEDGPTVPMVRGEDGAFEAVAACAPGARYKYQVRPDLAVPDPASRAQDGDVHGASIVTAQDYAWRAQDWRGRPWRETVVYEAHAGLMGGFNGVRAHLPRLAALGVTAIELMPIADFPGERNWGYDGVLPYAPDTAYGTPAALKDLVDAAHEAGLQIFLDVVYNHFGPDGNFLSAYASSFFTADVHTPWGNGIDFSRPQVRRFFIENALYWLRDYRFDGLRFDAVHAINDDDFLREMAAEIRATFPERHIHLILENENNEAALLGPAGEPARFDAQWNDDWHHCLHVLLTQEREGYYLDFQNASALLARCLAEGFAYQGDVSENAGGERRGTQSAHIPSTGFVICLQNHDQIGNRALGERLAVLARPEALRAAALLLMMTPQIPMLFMGEEFGETTPFLFFTDHHDELADAVRDGRRREFEKFAAFADPAKREKIPDPNAASTYERSRPQLTETTDEQREWAAFYRDHLALRARHLAPHLQDVQTVDSRPLGHSGARAVWRLGNGSLWTAAINLGPHEVPCDAGDGRLVASAAPRAPRPGHLPPYSAFVWLTEP